MSQYIDGFVLPILKTHLQLYQQIASQIAEIWKEHGALAYYEFVGDDLTPEGFLHFPTLVNASDDEVIIFGWTVFASREARDLANQKVPEDLRMEALMAPLVSSSRVIFDAGRMAYGGFTSLV